MWTRSIDLDWPARVVLLEALVISDSRDPWLIELAKGWRRNLPVLPFAARVQRWFQQNVRWVPDTTLGAAEVFQSPWALFSNMAGDCDCQSRAVAAILGAAGCRGELRYLLDDEQAPVHVFPVVRFRSVIYPLETSIAARFGEHPDRALDRLGQSALLGER